MRVLNVTLPESPHSVGHLGALASARWDVHVVPSYPARFPRSLDRAVTVHYHTLPSDHRGSSELRRAVGSARQRVRLAGLRTAHAAEQRLRAAGVDADLAGLISWPPAMPGLTDAVGAAEMDQRVRADIVRALGDHSLPLRMARWLAALIDELEPDIVHSGPLFQCAPHVLAARALCRKRFPVWMVSNWGIDLHFNARDPVHRPVIEAILANADSYLAECWRDVELARQYGFAGTVAGVVPLSAGIDLAWAARLAQPGPTSARRVIMLKGYQNIIGRALVGLEAVRRCADRLRGYELVVYSASDDVRLAGELLAADTGMKVTLHAPGSRSYEDVLRDHGRARVSIGLSMTDGLATWALEAMAMGAFPIQSTTSCFDELTVGDVTAMFVHPEDPDGIVRALARVVEDDALVDEAAKINRARAAERLDRSVVVRSTVHAYERASRARDGAATPAAMQIETRSGVLRGVMVNTVPKSGTHLLGAAVAAATPLGARRIDLYEGHPNQIARHRAEITRERGWLFVRGHVYHSPEWAALRRELDLKMIFLYRDPRDIVVSYVHWLMGPDLGVGALQTYIRDRLTDHQVRLRAMIAGFSFERFDQPDIATFMGRFVAWLDEPGIESVRFEELVSKETRDAALRKVYRYLSAHGLASDEESTALEQMEAAMNPARSTTYRQGRVATWRDEFDDDTRALFDRTAGDLVTRLGYEPT